MGSPDKIKTIIERIVRKHAIGIIFNCPKNEQAKIIQTIPEKKNIKIKGTDAYTSRMLQDRLGSILNIKHFTWDLLPKSEGRMIFIYEADLIKSSYNNVLLDFYKYKIPVLILMNGCGAMLNLRRLEAYKRVFTIEQDY